MTHHTPLISLLVAGFVLAFVFGGIAHRLRLSPLVGYLLAGVAIGPFTPGFIADATMAPQLAEVGVILLMFGVGVHFSMRDLMAVKAVVVPGALLQITVAALLGWGLGRLFGWDNGAALVFGLSLSVASTVVVLRGLEERGQVESERGRIAVGWLIVEDVVMVLVLVLMPPLAGLLRGDATPDEGIAGTLLLTVAKVGGFAAFMMIVGRRVIPWVLERVAGTGSRELFTLCVLGIALGVAYGSAAMFGVSFALGAFFAGVILSESEFSHRAASETLPLRDAFAVLFFVSVGMLFNPMILIERPLEVLATFAVIVLGNGVAAGLLARLLGKPRSTSMLLGATLAQIGEFSFIVTGLGVALGLLPTTGQDLVLAGALLSIVLNPMLIAWIERRAARSDEPAAVTEEAIAAVPPDTANHVIVIGYGRVGRDLARLLRSQHVPVVVIDSEVPLVERARADDYPTVRGNAVNERVLAEARPSAATAALVAIPNALEAGEIIATLRGLNPALSVVARGHSDTELKHLLDHGADAAVMAERELAHSLAEMVLAMPVYRGARSLPPTTATF
ncbi:YbaL family putative K(+) efflux transporter [Cognatilysobacter bugurensis]|uniref:Cation:proton antiport protein n=1 Tax=Cognatilysobacter bugurensis TaxID=543356 RepID=A0A918T1J0_9GAMM|nr:YbaL family putative K(+) efflux transporter [Lysobacter bugurensis]GHA80699.1 cation:proton antiport protein [Lysobacter bugurensis]